ncbi:fibronectin type III domain-containing protein [Nocardioides sp. NPDC051685]|uniref:fibronectin type III domain-containing protein n=1 Tax=Nocardioides sp. NPDC051685 TaxID=3364334 RepID=UPI0037AC8746
METTARNRTIGGIVIGAIILILLLVLFSCTVNSDPESSPKKDPTTGESSLPSDPDTIEPDDKPSEKDSDEPEIVDDDIVPAANTGVTFIPAGNVPSGSTPTCELDPSACEDTRPPGAGVDICEIRPDLDQCQEPEPPTTPPGDGEPTTPPDDDCLLGIGLLCPPDDEPTTPPSPGDKTAPSCGTRPVVVEKSITELILVTLISYEVSWGAATDDSGSVEYRVYVDGDRVATTSDTSYRSGGLELDPTKEYRLSVEAVDPSGNTAKCGRVKLTDNEAPVMGPVGCEVISSTELKLTWDDATDDSGEIQGYTVENEQGHEASNSTANSATFDGLTPGETYNFSVYATDWSDNDSEPSDVDCATTADEENPTVPAGLKISDITDTTATLSWTASTDDSAVDHYEVTWATETGPTFSGETYDTTFTADVLSPETTYTFTVVAVDVVDKQSSAATVTGTTKAMGTAAREGVAPRSTTLSTPKSSAPADGSSATKDEPSLDDILPLPEAESAESDEPAEPEATPSESESPAARPTTEEPTDEATEEAPAEEDEGGLLGDIVDSVTSAVAAVF